MCNVWINWMVRLSQIKGLSIFEFMFSGTGVKMKADITHIHNFLLIRECSEFNDFWGR